jgi:proteasome lid subunit RPN8/RPN11
MSRCTELAISRSVLDAVVTRAHRNPNCEIVGVLAGRIGGVAHYDVPLPNINPGPDSFLADPYEQFLAERRIEQSGDGILGVYHSHPLGDASYSVVDAHYAASWDCAHLVIGLAPTVECRAYAVLARDSVIEIPIRVVAD